MWLPDINVWIKLLNPDYSSVKQRFHRCHPQQLILCDIVKSELYITVLIKVNGLLLTWL